MLIFTLGPKLRSLLDAALVLDFVRFLMPSGPVPIGAVGLEFALTQQIR